MFTMLIGEIDAVPGHAGDLQEHKISTRFFSFIGPLIPFESLCVTFEHFEQHGRSSTHSYSGEKVRLNVWSILLGRNWRRQRRRRHWLGRLAEGAWWSGVGFVLDPHRLLHAEH